MRDHEFISGLFARFGRRCYLTCSSAFLQSSPWPSSARRPFFISLLAPVKFLVGDRDQLFGSVGVSSPPPNSTIRTLTTNRVTRRCHWYRRIWLHRARTIHWATTTHRLLRHPLKAPPPPPPGPTSASSGGRAAAWSAAACGQGGRGIPRPSNQRPRSVR
jgi:hypothetical protein